MSRTNRNAIGIGLIVGAALGAVLVASKTREHTQPGPAKLIEWPMVKDIALGLNRERGIPAEWKEKLGERYVRMVQEAESLVSGYTGTTLPTSLGSIHVFDRQDWILTNIANFKSLFEPLQQMHALQSRGNSAGAAILSGANQLILSGELGILIGYLAKRVLGQYDFSLLGKEALTTGHLYFVEPNIAGLQNELGLPSADFRLWIALHETTHAHEFEAHPWLRDHFNQILASYLENLDQDLQRFRTGRQGLTKFAERVVEGMADHQRWMELVMTKEQRQAFRHMQALMCVVEGYSNHVMNAVGRQLLPSYDLIRSRIEHRQTQRSTAERLFIRLTGLNIKFEQYRLGERFVEEVVRTAGMEVMNQVWEKPENIPMLEEIDRPGSWIKRLQSSGASLCQSLTQQERDALE